jgi:hypothetical protein
MFSSLLLIMSIHNFVFDIRVSTVGILTDFNRFRFKILLRVLFIELQAKAPVRFLKLSII